MAKLYYRALAHHTPSPTDFVHALYMSPPPSPANHPNSVGATIPHSAWPQALLDAGPFLFNLVMMPHMFPPSLRFSQQNGNSIAWLPHMSITDGIKVRHGA